MATATVNRIAKERPSLGITMPESEVYDIASMGEGLVLKKRETIELTVDRAAEFLDYPEFMVNDQKVDRERSDRHIITLTRAQLGGTFLWEHVNLVLCKVEGQSKPIRMNGNHTSWARLQADEEGLPKNTSCPVQLLMYHAKTMEDARRLYASLDRGRARSSGVVINSYLAGTEAFAGFKKATIRYLAQGVGVWLWESGTERTLHGSDDRAMLMLEKYHKQAIQVGTILKECQTKDSMHLRRAPVIAAMFATSQKAPQIAYDFWRDVRDGLGITDKDDPRYVLRNFLLTATLAKGVSNQDMKAVGQEYMYRSCVYKWNDHRAGKKARAIKVDLEANRPLAQ